jgi:tetraacyldisaccharide 4'-kinase
VGEERLVAIPQLLDQRPDVELIILDDAFQHRPVRAGLNILLTEYKNLYSRDFVLPAGDLRDVRSSSKRAHIIVVTKCKTDLAEEERKNIIAELKPAAHQQVYFTEIVYSQPYHLFGKQAGNLNTDTEVLLISGIANPKPLKDFLNKHVMSFDEMRFADHHIFSSTDLNDIKRQFAKHESPGAIILTTEKDAVRLQKFEAELKDHPIYVLPIKHRILFNEQSAFESSIVSFIEGYKKRNVN